LPRYFRTFLRRRNTCNWAASCGYCCYTNLSITPKFWGMQWPDSSGTPPLWSASTTIFIVATWSALASPDEKHERLNISCCFRHRDCPKVQAMKILRKAYRCCSNVSEKEIANHLKILTSLPAARAHHGRKSQKSSQNSGSHSSYNWMPWLSCVSQIRTGKRLFRLWNSNQNVSSR